MAANPRIKLPEQVKIGEVIEVKTLITHVMETGNRKDKNGKPIPRDIINTFVAKFGTSKCFAPNSARASRPTPTFRSRCVCRAQACSNSPGPMTMAPRRWRQLRSISDRSTSASSVSRRRENARRRTGDAQLTPAFSFSSL